MTWWVWLLAIMVGCLMIGVAWYADRRQAWHDGYTRGKTHNQHRILALQDQLREARRGPRPWVIEVPREIRAKTGPFVATPGERRMISEQSGAVLSRAALAAVMDEAWLGRGPFARPQHGLTHSPSGEWLLAADRTQQMPAVTADTIGPVTVPTDTGELRAIRERGDSIVSRIQAGEI